MPEDAAISGLDDASQARVRLLQSGRAVHAPILGIGLQPLDADLTSWALITRASGFDTFVATPSSANLAALVTDESGTDKLLFGTAWVAYTPTLTGFGTPTNVFFISKRIGDTLYIRWKFTSGTSTAVEARATLGFNGANGGINSDATKVPTIQLSGYFAEDFNGAGAFNTLIESNVGYFTFAVQTAGTNGLTKALGNGITASGRVFSGMCEIPISGW